jgi:hypothetical protein
VKPKRVETSCSSYTMNRPPAESGKYGAEALGDVLELVHEAPSSREGQGSEKAPLHTAGNGVSEARKLHEA